MGSRFLIPANFALIIFVTIYGVQSSNIEYQIRVWEGNSLLCDGVVIGKMRKHVLVAAHCIENRTNLEVQASIWDKKSDEMNVEIENVVQRHVHPRYNTTLSDPSGKIHDIAILHLNNSLGIPPAARIAELPTVKRIPYGKSFKVNVWALEPFADGKTMLGNFGVEMKILAKGDPKCQKYHNQFQFCAVSSGEMMEFCASDRGSPFIVNDIIIGFAAISNCDDDSPIVFTKVSSHLPFIKKHLN